MGSETEKTVPQQVRSLAVGKEDALNHKDAACAAPIVDSLPIFVCSTIPKTTIDFLELRSLRLHNSHYYYYYYLNRKSCVCRETNTHLAIVCKLIQSPETSFYILLQLVSFAVPAARLAFTSKTTTTTKTSRTKIVHSHRVSHTLRPLY